MGNIGDKEKYEATSQYWFNLFKADQTSNLPINSSTSTGFVGFFQPKFLNQTWGFQDPLACSNIDENPDKICSLQNNAVETFESSIWEYGFYVPHDQARLITALGGPSTFVRRLDYMHDQNITYIGNEPAFLTVFQYHYAGQYPSLPLRYPHPLTDTPKAVPPSPPSAPTSTSPNSSPPQSMASPATTTPAPWAPSSPSP